MNRIEKEILETLKDCSRITAPPGLEGVDALVWVAMMTRLSTIDAILHCFWEDEATAKQTILAIAGELGEIEWGADETWEAYSRWEERQSENKVVAMPTGKDTTK